MTSAEALVQLSGSVPRSARDDVQVTRARVLDTWAWIACRFDRLESRRRGAHSLGAVVGWDLLDTLMDLPAGLPVPMTAITESARRRVTCAAPGVLRLSARE